VRAVHIGFPKTATTFLQTRVFPRLARPGFGYVPQAVCARLFRPLLDDDDSIYDSVAVRKSVEQLSLGSEGVLFSFEGLTGHPYGSGFVNRSLAARRLKDLGFDRVVITIRNQADALDSAYRQHIRSGGVLRFREYVSFDPTQSSHLDARYFDYHLAYDLYASMFGPSHVLVLQYERLHEPEFVTSLAGFLAVEPIVLDGSVITNKSLSPEKTVVLRLFNHFLSSPLRPSSLVPRRLSNALVHGALDRVPFGNSGRSFHDAASRSAVEHFYAASNRRLEHSAGLTLTGDYPGTVRAPSQGVV